jgi:nitrite reductase/ring-hydroxylating ferredoxin subunit
MAWYKVADIETLLTPFLIKVNAGGKPLCLIYADQELYAVAATCPHAGADLSKGWCADGKLICPFHRYQYDLNTGRGALGQNDFIRTYAVEQRTDGVYVEVKSFFENLKSGFLSNS